MSYGNHKDNNNANKNSFRGEERKPRSTSSVGRNAYEIRTDILRIAFEIEKERFIQNVSVDMTGEAIVATAEKLNGFISKKND